MPLLKIEDPVRGLPRQPVPLRFAFLVAGLSWDNFTFLFSKRVEDIHEYLTAYEYAPGQVPREVRREAFVGLERDCGQPAGPRQCLECLPVDQFVWSDDLASAFSDFLRDYPGFDDARERGLSLMWDPVRNSLDDLLAACVDLTALTADTPDLPMSKREIRKRETQRKYDDIRKRYAELKIENPGKPKTWIADKISKEPIAQNLDAETIRKIMSSK
jgi:hypothetical protein